MKAMQSALALGAVASLAFVPASFAAVSCPNRSPVPILAPAGDPGACQAAIAKAASSYVKAQVKTDAKCMSKQEPGTCPNAKDTAKIQKAAVKARQAIEKACSVSDLGGLTSSYNGLAAADVASCTLSQNNVEGKMLTFTINGTPGKVRENKLRDKCVKTLNGAGVKYALGVLQTVNGCIAKQIKADNVANLAPLCVGEWSGGSFTAPGDLKTADKLAALRAKMEASVDKDCAPVAPALRDSIYACPGASTVAGFQNCLACETWDTTLDLLQQQYSETGTFVAHAAGAIQTAINGSAPGAKLLIQSGTYQEEVSITNLCDGGPNDGVACGSDSDCPSGTCDELHAGLHLVGCGGANDDRPLIDVPPGPGPFGNGIDAGSVDGLLFQSLKVGPWPENGIFVAAADGVTFRDIVADAQDVSKYAVFPVQSNNVLVEGCLVEHVSDAGIYVGQSTNIVVRNNVVHENVAGIEIENSSDAQVYNNYANGNTGGVLIFKLPDLPVQLSNNHEIFYNVSIANNRANVGAGTVGTVPDGTGFLVLSNDDGDFHHNIALDNGSFGFVLVDQEVINFLASPAVPFPTTSPDQKATGNKVHDNLFNDTNGQNPDLTAPNTTQGTAGPVVYAVFEEDPGPAYNNNCFENNVSLFMNQPVQLPVGNGYSSNCP